MKSDTGLYRPIAEESQHPRNGLPTSTTSLPPNVQSLLLVLLSVITVGSHYGKHSLSSLGPEIMETLDIKRLQFGFLFSSQAIPGIVLPIVGGLALTYIPHGPAAVVLSFCIMISTALCAVAISRKSYIYLFVGRFLFGLADGALTTLQGALVAHWFRRKVGSSFGYTLLVSRLSSFLGLSLPAYLSERFSLETAMWISVAVCLPPLLATVAYVILSSSFLTHSHPPLETNQTDIFGEAGINDAALSAPSTPRSTIALLRSFSTPFWTICYLWVVIAGTVFPILHFAPDAFSTHFGFTPARSSLLTASLVLTAGITSPAFGVLQDRIGRRPTILAASCSIVLLGILACAGAVGTFQVPLISGKPLLVLGLGCIAIGFSAAPVTLMASVALVVDDFALPAALGLYKATENAGLAVIHAVMGAFRDESGAYVDSFLGLAVLAGSGVLAALWLGRRAIVLGCVAEEISSRDGEALYV